MKKFLVFIGVITLVFGMAGNSAAFYMDFEEGLGNDGGYITGIPGVTFTNSDGLDWVYGDATTGSYNVTSVDTGNSWGTGRYNMYGNVFAWLGTSGNWGRIDFDDKDGTWFEIGVCSAGPFTLEAYDSDDNLIDSDFLSSANTQWEGYTDMTFLRVEAGAGENISWVKLSDSGNYWDVDEMSGDMAGGKPIPDPAAMFLLGSACLVGFGGVRRKFKR